MNAETKLTLEAEPYIPLSRAEVLRLCETILPGVEAPRFRRFADILTAWYHFTYHAELERLKASFADDSPAFAAELDHVVRAANFTKIDQADLNNALAEESVFRLRLAVDFDEFQQIVFYRRGASVQTTVVPQWFGLRKRRLRFTNFDHVLVYVRFKEHPLDVSGGAGRVSMLKLFTDVPEADLEMLFPNTQIRMRLIDKLFLGVPAFVSGVVVLFTKIGATLLVLVGAIMYWTGASEQKVVLDQAALLALLSGAGALGAYLWKQFSNFTNRKIRFMKTLADNLYFKTLANDSGVLAYLVDRAEESETKEVLLAFAELSAHGPLTLAALSQALQVRLGKQVAFDMVGAMEKLTRLGLVRKDGDALTVVSVAEAFALVDQVWDQAYTTEHL